MSDVGSSFLFFKQKTAYEMRISDWSSDVCSSDLEHSRLAAARDARFSKGHCPRAPAPAPSPTHVLPAVRGQVRAGDPAGVIGDEEAHRIGDFVRIAQPPGQIGRASCRERVCQYV